jgi:hypothetical protein
MKEEYKIEKEFEDIIRNKMTDEEFWGWVKEWIDIEGIVEQALEWETGTKRDELKHLREIINKNNKK